MFVRFKRRRLNRTYSYGSFDPGHAVDVVLVESVRSGAKVRQRFLGHLATYHERLIGMALHRRLLHRDAAERLALLVDDRDHRDQLMGAIRTRIPIPTPAEVADDHAQFDHLERSAHGWVPLGTTAGTTHRDAA